MAVIAGGDDRRAAEHAGRVDHDSHSVSRHAVSWIRWWTLVYRKSTNRAIKSKRRIRQIKQVSRNDRAWARVGMSACNAVPEPSGAIIVGHVLAHRLFVRPRLCGVKRTYYRKLNGLEYSLIVTTNSPFRWRNHSFGNPVLTVAAIDRLVHHIKPRSSG
jgi:hypothetical protein